MADEFFYLVSKTLNRLNLHADELPADISQWKDFLSRINRGFYDFEQERYLLERSMEISSKEMLELNKKFELARATAQLGLWIYDKTDEKIFWTKEVYKLFGLDPLQAVPDYDAILALVHEDDRENLNNLVVRAFTQGISYEIEFRIKNVEKNKYHWVYAVGELQHRNGDTHRYLSGLVMDIDRRKQTEKKLHDLQQKLLLKARQAGMSEIATSVLHNIGNILNSVNVSISLIKESLQNKSLKNFMQAVTLLKENASKPNYFSENEKGKLLPDYIETFTKKLLEDDELIKNEIENLNKNIAHIADIVMMQKEISGVYDIKEKINLSDIIEMAIKMCGFEQKQAISITKNYGDDYFLMIDKVKLLQILVNLIKNAKESLIESNNQNKHIDIRTYYDKSTENYFIEIQDNGVGIPEENLTKIFSMGYTTKPSGHGFGLHGSANTAKQLGGSLKAVSKGLNEGACFILQLSEKAGDQHG